MTQREIDEARDILRRQIASGQVKVAANEQIKRRVFIQNQREREERARQLNRARQQRFYFRQHQLHPKAT
jgi:hypothetical protein